VQPNPVLQELDTLDKELASIVTQTDSAWKLTEILRKKYPPQEIVKPKQDRSWELVGLYYRNQNRVQEALGIFWSLYIQMLEAQSSSERVHKGMPLVWMSDCFRFLGFPVHAKRYLMLTLCEDALLSPGEISPLTTGVYFRLVWVDGVPHGDLQKYAEKFRAIAAEQPSLALFPEALLQRVDDAWLTEFPSVVEALSYRINPYYVRHLLSALGDGSGETLEVLAEYLMACMPGCRTRRRLRSSSTDYDIVCAMDGLDVDFRSEFGRYFVCECKDWVKPADFTTMAKFCRVLDSIKARFGILFSKSGVSGGGKGRDAELEQLKVFQDRGIVILPLTLSDLEDVANGTNLISLLRNRYETVRLDLRAQNRAT
jgi:hypothetical protein